MKYIQCYQTLNPCYIKATPMKPVGIVVHSTGANNPNLKRYVDCPEYCGVNAYGNHWNKPGADKMVHAFIGRDKDGQVLVVNTLPYTSAAWGVGKGVKGSYNYNPTGHIQFEMCEDNLTDRAYFEAVIASAVEYCAALCREWGLTADSIVSHREAHDRGYGSNHGDPHHWMSRFGMTMDDFRAAVRDKLKGVIEIMGKYVEADKLINWINENAVDMGEATQPAPVPAIAAGDHVVLKNGVTNWGTGSSNKSIPTWAQNGKTTFKVLEIVLNGTEARIGNDAGAYTGTAYIQDLVKVS